MKKIYMFLYALVFIAVVSCDNEENIQDIVTKADRDLLDQHYLGFFFVYYR